MTAKQTPLADLLDGVPADIVLGVPGEGPFPSHTNIPIGVLARDAAAELRRLRIENGSLWRNNDLKHAQIQNAADEVQRLREQRDALLVALEAMLLHTADLDPMQGYRPDEDFSAVKQARAAIKAVEEGK